MMLFLILQRNILLTILLGFTMLFYINRSLIFFVVLCFLAGKKIFQLARQAIHHLFNLHQHYYHDSIIEPFFSILGHISKADGNVSSNSIRTVEKVITAMKCSITQRKVAIQAFNQGKNHNFNLQDALQRVHVYLLFHPQQEDTLIKHIISVGHADGKPTKRKRNLLHIITSSINKKVFNHHQQWQNWQEHQWEHAQHQRAPHQQQQPPLHWAYQTLDCSSNDSLETVTKKYRKLLSKYHPDRLAAKNASENEIKAANDKTHDIKKAFDMIKKNQVYSV